MCSRLKSLIAKLLRYEGESFSILYAYFEKLSRQRKKLKYRPEYIPDEVVPVMCVWFLLNEINRFYIFFCLMCSAMARRKYIKIWTYIYSRCLVHANEQNTRYTPTTTTTTTIHHTTHESKEDAFNKWKASVYNIILLLLWWVCTVRTDGIFSICSDNRARLLSAGASEYTRYRVLREEEVHICAAQLIPGIHSQ